MIADMDTSIRLARPDDDAAIGELLVRAFEDQYARKMPGHVISEARKADLRNQAEKRSNATVLVAEHGGRIVGTISLYRWGAPRSEAWIDGAANMRLLAVAADRLGMGLSTALMDEAEGLARSWSAPAVCLHIRRPIPGLARLYEARGYLRDPTGDIDRMPEVFLEAFVLRL